MTPSEQELRTVLSQYGLTGEYPITWINGGTANKNYLVQGLRETFVLRVRNPKYSDEEWVRYEEEYLRHVYSKGFPVPVPILNKHGKSWSLIGQNVIQLYPYLTGQPCDPNNEAEIQEAGTFLSKLHSASSDFNPKYVKAWPRFDDPRQILDALEKVNQEYGTVIKPKEKATLEYVESNARQLLERIPDSEYHGLPKTVVHGDYHPANVKYTDHEICGLFDFDWICVQPRLRDIVDGIIYFTGIRPASIEGDSIYSLTQGCMFEIERSLRFIQSYLTHSVPPLSSNELDALPYMMRGRLIHSRVQAIPKIPADRHVEMLTRDIEIPLRWLDAYEEPMVRIMKQGCNI